MLVHQGKVNLQQNISGHYYYAECNIVGNDTEEIMKNTARNIFKNNRKDLSDPALKAVEAEVLNYAKAEV